MALTLAQRAHCVARHIAKKRGTTLEELGRLVGYTNRTAFSGVLNGSKTLPKSLAGRMLALDETINPAFLSGDSDEMLLPGNEQPAIPDLVLSTAESNRRTEGVRPGSIIVSPELAQMFTDMSATIRMQQETIHMLLEEKRKAPNVGE